MPAYKPLSVSPAELSSFLTTYSTKASAYVDVGVSPPVMDHYMASKIAYPAPLVQSSPWREVSNICLDCHHTFSGDEYTRDGNGKCIRHPNTDSERDDWANINDLDFSRVEDEV